MRGVGQLGIAVAMAAWGLLAGAACAADKLKVGKSVPFAWMFQVIDVGTDAGIFAKHDIELEVSSFAGDARMQQALTAGSIEIGLGGGPGIGFMAKGVPAKAIAAFANQPKSIAVVLPYDSPYKSLSEMKGRKFAVTTAGSLTDWLIRRAAVAQGWKPDDVVIVPLGGLETFIAGLKTKQVDALMLATEVTFPLEDKKEARILETMDKYAPKFHTHLLFARDDLIAGKPELVRRFLQAFFESIAFIKKNKAKTVEVTARSLKLPVKDMERTWEGQIDMFNDDGSFDPAAMAVLRSSLVDMGIVETPPKDEDVLMTKFLPVKP